MNILVVEWARGLAGYDVALTTTHSASRKALTEKGGKAKIPSSNLFFFTEPFFFHKEKTFTKKETFDGR